MFKTTCFDIWRQEKEIPYILTLCKELDDIIGGGVAAGKITELCGGPGCGKTQMCLQLCINVQFPKAVGGIQGKSVYLDTNQDFSSIRLREMSICTEKRFHRAWINNFDTIAQEPFTVTAMMDGVNYIYCKNYSTLVAAVEELPDRLNEDKTIKLIVIDSFSFPLRVIEDVAERTGLIYSLLTKLHLLARVYQVVVVITNELTTRVNGDDWKIFPALGDSHTHKISQRIILSKSNEKGYYVALVEKSNSTPRVGIPFVVVITNELTTRVNGDDWKIFPALGDSHTHKISQRIILSKSNEKGYYVALVEKSNSTPRVGIPFVIKQSGVRDIS